jgi:hypothetical protein
MSNRARTFAAILLGLLLSTGAFGDTLEMKDGRVLHGRYLGGTQAVVRFEVNGEVQAFNVTDIVAITFTGKSNGSGATTPAPAPAATAPAPASSASAPTAAAPPSDPASAAQPASNTSEPPVTSQDTVPQSSAVAPAAASALPAPASATAAQDPAAQYGEITLPVGQSLLVRMIDGVDSSRNQVGDVFHASLETDLYIHDTLIARKGTDIYGRLANAQEAGHFSGRSELQLELTRIVINGRDYPLVSSDYNVKGRSRNADTAKKVGGGAILGAILGGIVGGGPGAAIGAGAGGAVGATSQVLTRGEKVRVPSETLLEFRLQQPATVTPVQS